MVHKKIKGYVKQWEKRCYKNGIPDEVPISLKYKVPSYKSIALCLLKNDLNLKDLGFSTKHSNWYNYYKKEEIIKRTGQLKLF